MNSVLKSKIIKFAIGAVLGFLVGLFAGILMKTGTETIIALSILGPLCGISCAVSWGKFIGSCKFVSDFGFIIGGAIPAIGWLFIIMAYVFRVVLTVFIGWIFGVINAILEIHCAARYGIDLVTYKSQNK